MGGDTVREEQEVNIPEQAMNISELNSVPKKADDNSEFVTPMESPVLGSTVIEGPVVESPTRVITLDVLESKGKKVELSSQASTQTDIIELGETLEVAQLRRSTTSPSLEEEDSLQSVDINSSPVSLSSPPLPNVPVKNTLQSTIQSVGTYKRDWLLRLFESEFFNAHLAVSYLHQYSETTGIQHYLCERIWRDVPIHEISFFIPQLCHLAVHGTEKTRAEEFVSVVYLLMRISRRCRHSAMVILWCFENYWLEYPTNQRITHVLQQIQGAVFGPKHANLQRSERINNLPSLEVSMIGFGLMLLGVTNLGLVESMGPLILMQSGQLEPVDILQQQSPSRINSSISSPSLHRRESTASLSLSMSPSVEELHLGKAFGKTLKQFINTASSAMGVKKQRVSTDQAVNSVFVYTAEMQFVVSLIDISRRMCAVEKKSRKRTLAAELNVLNGSLPAKVCLPLWCCSEDQEHDRILRIVPEEASTLNSAERVPLLLFIEVLSSENTCGIEELLKLRDSAPSPPSISSDVMSQSGSSAISEEDTSNNTNLKPFVYNTGTGDDYSERMRTAAVMLAQLSRQAADPKADKSALEHIRSRLIVEMETIEKEQSKRSRNDSSVSLPYIVDTEQQKIREDPSVAALGEDWELKTARIRENSPFGHLDGWRLVSVIAKSGTDMRQEHLACQLIETMQRIWQEEELDLWVRPLKVLVAADGGGLIETVANSLSLHSIRKAGLARTKGELFTLKDHFVRTFGPVTSPDYLAAVDAFVSSLAGYSLVTFVLSLKDRHNGNILLDSHGHLVHIDFGFMLGNSPGGNYVTFETAPFKLTAEYLDLMESVPGAMEQFRQRFLQGYLGLRKAHERVELSIQGLLRNSRMPALEKSALEQLRTRLVLGLTGKQVETYVDRQITLSAHNMLTRLYDTFQYYSNGIL